MTRNRSLKRSLSDFIRHPWLHFMSISTVTISLIILGGFLIVYRNLDNVAERTNPQMTGTLYLREGISESEIQRLKEKILIIDSVQAVVYKNKQSVVTELQAFLGGASADVIPGSELFPDVLEIDVRKDFSPDVLPLLRAQLEKYPEVMEADFSEDWLVQYKKVRHMMKFVGIALMLSLIIGCSFIIANFMGMRHQSRKSQMDIVRLIGANHGFILTPILWEAIIEGIIGSVVSLVALFFGKIILGSVLTAYWSSMLGISRWDYLTFSQALMLVGIGMLMSLLGSITVFIRYTESSEA